MKHSRLLINLALIVGAAWVASHFLSFEEIPSWINLAKSTTDEAPFLTALCFVSIYVVLTAASIPAASGLSLIGGALYGNLWGTLLVLTSATMGSAIAFWIARKQMRATLIERFPKQFSFLDAGIRKNGSSFLFMVRLNPVVPFFVVNLLMGLTPLSLRSFIWVSFVGMLPGTWLYVNAGLHLSEIKSTSEILSGSVILSLVLLGLAPFLIKQILRFFRKSS